jgi:protein TonB
MFNNLLESKKKGQKKLGSVILTGFLHYGMIALAIYATANAAQEDEKPKEEKVDFVATQKDETPKAKEQPPPLAAVPLPPKGFQTLTAPVEIPDVLPDIDLTHGVTEEGNFTGRGLQEGSATGEKRVEAKEGQTYFAFQVEQPVTPIANTGVPRYPDILRQAGVEGDVLATFVVDTTGRADPGTLRILRASHELFAAAVKQALPAMRFVSAEVGGKKVKQLVQQPFSFAITK